MDFSLPENLNFNVMTIILGVYLIAIGILYYIIYHKHHKRNKVELDELVTLVTKFYSLTMLSTFFIYLGGACMFAANTVKYERSEVVLHIVLGIIIISATIINYIFYIKKSLIDYDPNIRAENKKRTLKIGEVLELIFFLIFILMPLWQIPTFMKIADKKELVIEVLKTFGISIASTVLLIVLNPVDVKGKIKNFLKKSENKEDKKIYK